MLPGVPESPRYMTRAFQFTTPFLATRESSPEMATYGSIEAFNPKADDWTTYAERLQHYLQANDVSDQKRAILLTVCGAPTYKLLRSLVDGGKVDEKSYDELVEVALRPQASCSWRGRAYRMSLLALYCEYGDKLSEMLRDRLVCGVNHNGIQRKLLGEKDLTYDKAYALALSVETSERDAAILQSAPASEEKVCYTAPPKPSQGGAVSCYRCGGAHLATQCKHKDAIDLPFMQQERSFCSGLSI